MTGTLNAALRRVPPWIVHAGAAGWALWWLWLAAAGALGPDPVARLEQDYGTAALWLLLATLAVTPLRRWTGVTLLRFRRAFGLWTFGFGVAHLVVWLFLDLSAPIAAIAELARPHITAGVLSLLLMVPLALTSTDAALRRLGAQSWRRLHRLVYPAAILAATHQLWIARGWETGALLWVGATGLLLGLRVGMRPGGGH
ncbi:MAG: ferric reductase-like transmembrane domain-containing protein [Rubellimicrobium sp.]|nr:ferric reductase-like transmembrane domain-containing protein [Rubellimicrobium sp.]